MQRLTSGRRSVCKEDKRDRSEWKFRSQSQIYYVVDCRCKIVLKSDTNKHKDITVELKARWQTRKKVHSCIYQSNFFFPPSGRAILSCMYQWGPEDSSCTIHNIILKRSFLVTWSNHYDTTVPWLYYGITTGTICQRMLTALYVPAEILSK